MRLLRRLLVVLVLVATSLTVVSAGPAFACSCAVLDDHLDRADAAFVGVVTEVDEPAGRIFSSADAVTVRFAVERVQKGAVGDDVELTTVAEQASCGYDFTEGHRYQVFATDGQTGLCAGNEELGIAATPRAAAPQPDPFPTALWITVGGLLLLVGTLGVVLVRRRNQ